MRYEECDVLVVGLGPAGAAAATSAAQAGARVVAIDSRASSTDSARPAEFIPLPLGGNSRADAIVIQSIVGVSGNPGEGPWVEGGVRGCVIDRGLFERALVEFAMEAGAQLWRSAMLAALDADASVATISEAGEAGPIRFRALVAADGHASTVARLLGMGAPQTMRATLYRVPLRVPLRTIDAWVSVDHPGGYGWLIPAGPEAIVGTGMAAEAAEGSVDALHRQLASSGIVGREIRARASGTVAVGGMRERLAWGNILFAGDAAGLAHPLTGAGIFQAVVSGEAAGRAAAEWSSGHLGAIPAYEARMRGQFGATIDNALRRREQLQALWTGEPGERSEAAVGWNVVRGAFDS